MSTYDYGHIINCVVAWLYVNYNNSSSYNNKNDNNSSSINDYMITRNSINNNILTEFANLLDGKCLNEIYYYLASW